VFKKARHLGPSIYETVLEQVTVMHKQEQIFICSLLY